MARQNINNNESGLAVRNKLNENFTELYSLGGGGGAAIRPAYISGRYYPVENCGAVTSSGALAANSLALRPFIVDAEITLSSISVRIGTVQGGGFCRFGLWASGGSGMPIDIPLAESAAVSTASAVTLTHSIIVPVVLEPGIYWTGYVQDNAVSRVHIPTQPAALGTFLFGAASSAVASQAAAVDFLVSHTFGAMPNLTGVDVMAGQNTNLRAPLLILGAA